jgi:hypothetical protein
MSIRPLRIAVVIGTVIAIVAAGSPAFAATNWTTTGYDPLQISALL